MGRYYSGDIEGKFWFAVQSSDAPERFGAYPMEPGYVEYYFEELEPIQDELAEIRKNLRLPEGDYYIALRDFFKENNGYNDEMIEQYFVKKKLDPEQARYMLSEYADFELGKQIEKCVKKQGDCSFTAEL